MAWRCHPELVDLLSLEGMNKMVYWAAAAVRDPSLSPQAASQLLPDDADISSCV